ncbi:MAG: hypothetical protein U9N37_08385 [Thermodesulfobacteriota bacterium]|nr:hypothetical protein [Thermodesulfobacteriota bacterium]
MKKVPFVLRILSILAALILFSAPVGAGDFPDLVGNWTSKGLVVLSGPDYHHSYKPSKEITYKNAAFTLMIVEQNGRGFYGKFHKKDNPSMVEHIIGVISFDNETLYMVDQDGYLDGRLISPTKMELVYRETDLEGMVIGAYQLTKLP